MNYPAVSYFIVILSLQKNEIKVRLFFPREIMAFMKKRFAGICIVFFSIIITSEISFSQTRVIDSLKLQLNNTEGEERIKTLIGISYNYLRISVDSSLKYSDQILKYSKETNNERGIARALFMMGNAYIEIGENKKALSKHKEAYSIFNKLSDTLAIGVTYNSLGMDYHNLGQYDKAIEQYLNASRIAKSFDDNYGRYYASNNIGTIYEDWDKYQLALEYYQHALNIAYGLDDRTYIGISLQNIGVAHQKLGNNAKALEYLEQSLQVSREIGDTKGIYNSHLNRGQIFESMGEREKAISSFKSALEAADNMGNKSKKAEAILNLGREYLQNNDLRNASLLLVEIKELMDDIEETNLKKDIYEALSEYYSKTGDFKNAYLNYLEFTALKDTIFNQDSRKEISEMQTLYELDKKENEILIQNLKIEKQQSRLYYILSAIALLIVLSALLFSRYKLKQKNFRAELERKNIEIEQRLLRTQMNPHFIFNSLNSINSFISDSDPDSAQSFLSKFARLMRYILENSRKTMVPLEDEVNTLKLNMELEQLRFDNKFDFKINIEGSIDEEYTYVPPMLVQPFVENAILHGLAGKEEEGLIEVEFKATGKIMLCTIEDNGIGRKKAGEIKKTKGKNLPAGRQGKHRSLGMQVTKERLDILAEKYGGDISFEIIDLEDTEGNALGTRAVLRIPFEEE
jgi:tetratricopeptide (TPR) repeat protein